MALINNIYVFLGEEEVVRNTAASSHPVETGLDLTDNVKRSPLTLSISGELVGVDYGEKIRTLEELQKQGKLVEYVGINLLSNALITKFSTSHGDIVKGCKFTMELQEVRIATSPYSAGSGNGGLQQIEEVSLPVSAASTPTATRTHTVKPGDTLSGLARSYYGNWAEFPKIFEANRDKLTDPNKIRDGQVLTIP